MKSDMQEIGIEGIVVWRKRLKFGDIIENGWASERNPTRFGIVVKVKDRFISLTNGKGRFWDLAFDKETKLEIIGSALNPGWQEILNNSKK